MTTRTKYTHNLHYIEQKINSVIERVTIIEDRLQLIEKKIFGESNEN